jgi:hypothetical protein
MARKNKCFDFSEELHDDLPDVLVGREVQVEVDGVVDAAHDGRLEDGHVIKFNSDSYRK